MNDQEILRDAIAKSELAVQDLYRARRDLDEYKLQMEEGEPLSPSQKIKLELLERTLRNADAKLTKANIEARHAILRITGTRHA